MADPVSGPTVSESLSCLTNCDSCSGCRRFPGRLALTHISQFSSWLSKISCVEMLQAKMWLDTSTLGKGMGLDFVTLLRFGVFLRNMRPNSRIHQWILQSCAVIGWDSPWNSIFLHIIFQQMACQSSPSFSFFILLLLHLSRFLPFPILPSIQMYFSFILFLPSISSLSVHLSCSLIFLNPPLSLTWSHCLFLVHLSLTFFLHLYVTSSPSISFTLSPPSYSYFYLSISGSKGP